MNAKWLLKRVGTAIYNNRSNIEFAVGTGLVVVGTGMMVSNAEEVVEVKKDLEQQRERIRLTDESDGWKDDKARGRACYNLATSAIKGYGKALGPGAAVEAGGLALMGISHATDRKEIAVGAAALTSLAAQFESYREACRADQGDEKDEEYLLGTVKEVEMKDDGTTESKTTVTKVAPHTIMFDESNPNWEKADFANYEYLSNHLRWLNERLWREGVLFGNDIRRDIGEGIDANACDWGITAMDDDGNRQWLSFGIEKNTERAQAFRDGKERSFVIVLNVEPQVNKKLYRLKKYLRADGTLK
ncbi:MAG: hypothetical protein J6U54_18010 [Clostridiales bacterium]|nr:hypothetical protein [Clostridiales bacterium]